MHFVVNTDREEDVKYLDELVMTSELYKKITIPSLGYNEVWGNAVERNFMYIKIDDDIVRSFTFNDTSRWLTQLLAGLFQRRSHT